ncbi:MAG: response regulator [Deltaproteobacteria bacterium]|nr:response regulator [Deltaproteobacteria bacterium]
MSVRWCSRASARATSTSIPELSRPGNARRATPQTGMVLLHYVPVPHADRVSVPVPLTRRALDQEADRVLVGGLRDASAGTAICFSVFGLYNALLTPEHARAALVTYDALLVLAGVVLHIASRRALLDARAAPFLAAGLALAVVGNILLALVLVHESASAFYVALVLVLTSGAMLRTRWAVSLGGVIVGAWAVVASVSRDSAGLMEDVFVIFAGCTVAAISHFGQKREHLGLVTLRERDTRRKAELEAALAAVAAARDELDRKVEARTRQLRDELATRTQLEEQLRHAQKMEAVGRLAGGVAHDFNNLLTIISSGLELGSAHAVDPPAAEALADAFEATRRASELTRGLLVLGRKQELDRKPIEVVEVLEGVERMVARIARANVRLVRRVESTGTHVLADRGQLEQVLLNLAINACDAMPEGGTLTTTVEVRALDAAQAEALHLEPGSYVCVAVSDTGTGIDATTRPSIFEPFFTTKPMGKGTGLGLAIAHGIVQQHGGAIELVSAVGQGSTFSVFLPRIEAEPAKVVDPSSHPPPAATHEQSILVVEDEPALRRSLVRTLTRQGYHVLQAVDGSDALRIAEGLSSIDLLLSDVVMPGLDGPEVAATLRARWPTLRVLFVSGYSDDRLADAGALGPRDRLLSKPYTANQLVRAVREVVDGTAA